MGNRKGSIDALLRRCDVDIAKIEREYADSLHSQEIRSDLQMDIKSFCENLRSVLDYLTHDIRERHCPGADPHTRFYFPIIENRSGFEGQVSNWYPDLDAKVPALWSYLESIQPYHKEFAWLGTFNSITNDNKHKDLVAQTRIETEQVRVSMPSRSVTWTPQKAKFGSGVSIGNVPVDPRTQMPVPHPSQKVERIIWVDFRFQGENVSALGLLKEVLAGVRKITMEIQEWL